jgi:hypothetical protein
VSIHTEVLVGRRGQGRCILTFQRAPLDLLWRNSTQKLMAPIPQLLVNAETGLVEY